MQTHPLGRLRSLLLLCSSATLAGALLVALPTTAPASPAAPARDTYRNPLAPRVPGDGTVDSCADPTVLRGQRPGARYWYMYCTTDPLNDEDLNAEGQLNFRPIPMMRSRNLVDWTYLGDALPEPPSYAAEGAGLWAPDVVYSRATNRYYLTFVVTNTEDSLRGEGACASDTDSAIGVAVSASPTGPWHVSERPVVPPRADPNAECAFFWTYDPDVLGDTVGRRSTLYFGSYFGGIHASRIRFTADGARAVGERTPITIGNRYEGSNVVERKGWYYLFVSATNCCNGPLTSYGVFAGRSRSPLGPFRDRNGVSLLQGRVGGSPVLLPNGNRWLGVGHNSVFTDAAGRWWTVYHAADRFDPYFATDPGFTKRPALLDPLTWAGGWPQVRGGKWASNRRMPAPATRRDHPSRYRPSFVQPVRLGRRLPAFSDDFAGGLEPAWRWTREPAAGAYGVERGALRFDVQEADIFVDTDNASILSRRAPRGDFAVQTRVRLNLPPEGCCYNFAQAGLLVHNGEDRFVKLVHASIWETRQTEWAKEVASAPPEYPRYGNGVVGPPGDVTSLRIVVDRRSGPDRYTAFTRQDDKRWVRGGTWTHQLGANAKIGLVSMGLSPDDPNNFTARFLDVRSWKVR